MSGVRCLQILLGDVKVGSLFGLDTGYSYFRFDESYALNSARPILSIQYQGSTEDETTAVLLDRHLSVNAGIDGRLPVFFRNLLPEGVLRSHLILEANLSPDDELGLLAFCGTDLPGNVVALHEELSEKSLGRLLTQDLDSYELSSFQLPTPEATSLSGVQPKVSLINDSNGRYVMRSKNHKGLHFIGKLPASGFAGLPEVEHLSLRLARAANVSTCEAELLPLTAIADKLPFSMNDDARNFLLVHRFDRDVETQSNRLHMEDFAQVLSLDPEFKYKGTYLEIGLVLLARSTDPLGDIDQLLRRIMVNELIGNYDAHAKNFSLLYAPDGRTCSLSPAYDVVAYSSYLSGNGHGMRFTNEDTPRKQITPAIVRTLANYWNFPENKIKDILKDVVLLAMNSWPTIIADSQISDRQKEMLLQHFNENAHVQRLMKSNATSKIKP